MLLSLIFFCCLSFILLMCNVASFSCCGRVKLGLFLACINSLEVFDHYPGLSTNNRQLRTSCFNKVSKHYYSYYFYFYDNYYYFTTMLLMTSSIGMFITYCQCPNPLHKIELMIPCSLRVHGLFLPEVVAEYYRVYIRRRHVMSVMNL